MSRVHVLVKGFGLSLSRRLGPAASHSDITSAVKHGCKALNQTKSIYIYLMPRSHLHGSPCRFYYGLNLKDDSGNAKFRSPIRMHYIHMIKNYYV